jgi:DNA-binding TFAR19-related protein (PDSD5 family)
MNDDATKLLALENAVKSVMTKEAVERFGNVKAVNPEKAVQVLMVLSQLMNAGRIKEVTDSVLKDVLVQLEPAKREFKIKRV